MAQYNEKIMKQVVRKEKDNQYIERCLAVNICPECGKDLDYEYFGKGYIEYECTSESCSFTFCGYMS